MAKVSCAVNSAENSSFDGMSIEQVISQYGQFFNIPKTNLVILVNDEEVSGTDYIIQPDDEVEFVKASGEKGQVGDLHRGTASNFASRRKRSWGNRI
jgi:molybdopterin converting factor small subunit